MPFDTKRLYEILRETTDQFRKGPEKETRDVGAIRVTEVYLMPPEAAAPVGLEMVDMVFLTVGVDRAKAEARRAEMIGILNAWPCDATTPLRDGPSYIAIGADIGDQGAAFCLFALGQVLGLWKVITPASMGFSGDEAREMAGRGFIMITGYGAQVPA